MCNYKPVTHVIFDVDGLLLDTERLYTIMTQAICDPFNKKFTQELKLKLMGRKEREGAAILLKELDLPLTVDEYLEQLNKLVAVYFPKAELLPGAEKLVRHLAAHNIPIALATGSDSKFFNLKTTDHRELFSLFLHAVFSSEDPDVKQGKPAPDIFLVANSKFNDAPKAEEVLVFEDAPNGVAGGLAAGMQVVWVPDAAVDRKSVGDNTPTLTLSSLEDFRPELFGLPPYEA